jgi:5,10-methylenetetrahydrofolate reductase
MNAAIAHSEPLYASLPGDIGVSFEFFPPKTEKMAETLWESVRTLSHNVSAIFSVLGGKNSNDMPMSPASEA